MHHKSPVIAGRGLLRTIYTVETMRLFKLSTTGIESGLDRKQLSTMRKRFLDLNAVRLTRTRSALPERQRIFLDLLPLLFHLNHPALPGYITHSTPKGVSDYQPGASVLYKAQKMVRSFSYQREPKVKDDIFGIYVMGSCGTVAHSRTSDLDIWLCYRPGLADKAIEELQAKARNISRWAGHMGLEAHFFVMNNEDFRDGKTESLSSESSGSAQHYLLLDEFYRTALYIAGRTPLWWYVPVEQEADYLHYTQVLLSKKYLNASKVIDFGHMAEIPGGEFVGAGIWQLYKGIESPYKSILKLLLTEAYADEFPHVESLSMAFKRAIYKNRVDADELDPYVMVCRKVEAYLKGRNELKRLQLARRCFYFKVNKKLTRAPEGPAKSWQRCLLEKLVEEWRWNRHHLLLLDSRQQWKARRVINERRQLVQELTHCYRFLNDFARRNHFERVISPQEMRILGRKLYAAFERRAGKIERINPGISDDLEEDTLTFTQSLSKAGQLQWVVVPQHPEAVSNNAAVLLEDNTTVRELPSTTPYLQRSRNLMELISWCHINGILTSNTKLHVDAPDSALDERELTRITRHLQRRLPLSRSTIQHDQFRKAATIRHIYMFINVGTDPMASMHNRGMHRLSSRTDPLGYSGLKENLVLTIDTISINSWGEINTQSYDSNALVQCLEHHLNLQQPGQGPLPTMDIQCFCQSRAEAITRRLETLFHSVSACYHSSEQPENTRYLFEMEDRLYLITQEDNAAHIHTLQDQVALERFLSLPQKHFSPIVLDDFALNNSPLAPLLKIAQPDTVSIAYQRKNDSAQVFIIDEMGTLSVNEMPFWDERTLLTPLNHFIRAILYRQLSDLESAANREVNFYEVVRNRQSGGYHLEQRRVAREANQERYFHVQAIAELNHDGDIVFSTIYCNDREFSELDYEEALYRVVARYILSRRRGNERYPCYITDLDLSRCIPEQRGPLQTNHYLEQKKALEALLNQALQDA